MAVRQRVASPPEDKLCGLHNVFLGRPAEVLEEPFAFTALHVESAIITSRPQLFENVLAWPNIA